MATRHNPRCSLCGAPTTTRTIRGGTGWVCTECGSLTVEAGLAMELLSSVPVPPPPPPLASTPLPPPSPRRVTDERTLPPAADLRDSLPSTPPGWDLRDEPAPRPRRRARRSAAPMMLALAASVALLVLAVPASFVVFRVVRDRAAVERTAPVAPRAVALSDALGPPPAPVVLPDPPPPVPEEEEELPDEGEEPRAEPTGGSPIDQGWRLVDADPAAAARLFRAALDQRPGDPEASYGLGYALLQAGDRDGARPWLCQALASGNGELHREVQSLLDHRELTCSP